MALLRYRFAKLIGIAGMLFVSGQCPAASAEGMFSMVEQTVLDRLILKRPSYDYAPAVIEDGGKYLLYWCAGVAGDFILRAEAVSLVGPWHSSKDTRPNSYDVALQPTGSSSNFDGLHACDPNLIKVGADYYMYYGGAAADSALTAIGVTTSKDGLHFLRGSMEVGRLSARRLQTLPMGPHGLTYGAGQPAILYQVPYFYLSFTDSTGSGANPGNGAGQRIRHSNLTRRNGPGWARREPGQHTAEFSYLESFGIDWMFDDMTNRIVVASNRSPGRTNCTFSIRIHLQSSPAANFLRIGAKGLL
jgi:hypothetical protein